MRSFAGAAAIATGLFLLAGCGGAESSQQGRAAGAGPTLGVPLNLADCEDWRQGSVEERLGTIAQLTDFAGDPVAGTKGRGPTLGDDEAYDLIDGYCKLEFAGAFKLYKLYTRAAAFSGG
jgi:hypothetical protein